jgi:glycosyltransferase involved in cell wall biosynthesis
MTRTVLLMTYEFPPAGGSGVQRITKFARYLPDFGWVPVVLTSAPAKGRPTDESLLADVRGVAALRLPPLRVSSAAMAALAPLKYVYRRRPGVVGRVDTDPAGLLPGAGSPGQSMGAASTGYSFGSEPIGRQPVSSRSAPATSVRLARSVSMDDASWWAAVSAGVGVAFARRHAVQAVVATGPPFSVSCAGRRLARRLGVPLIVDMRDGWRDNPAAWYPNDRARRHAVAAERAVVAAADVVLATTAVIADEARALGGHDVRVLPNGYDAADIVPWRPSAVGPLRLAFMGRMYRNHSEPWQLLDALARLRVERPELPITLEIIGDAWSAVRHEVTRRDLDDSVTFAGYLPHRQAAERLSRADVAVAIVVDRPGARATALAKIFEYMATAIPTLALVPPDGESARLIRAAAAGWVVAPHDVEAIKARLVELAEAKRRGSLGVSIDSAVVARYDRRALTGELAAVLDEVSDSHRGRPR